MHCDRTISRLTLRGAVLPSLVLLTACVGPFQQWGEEASFMSKAPSFDPSVLEREKVAVLNAVVGFGLEGYSHLASRSLLVALATSPHPIKAVSAHETLSRLNQQGLATLYAEMISEYLRSGILNRAGLEKIGQALEVGYVFQPSMAAFSQFTSSRFSLLGLRLFQTRISTLRLSVQLWSTRSGEIVWESYAEGTLATEDVREFRIPFKEIASRLWQRMLQDLADSSQALHETK